MTRTLVMIAFAGFILAVACIAGAIALGGGALLHHHWRHWNVTWDDDRHGKTGVGVDASEAAATREIAWPGGDKVSFDVPADVQYTQGPGPAKLTISGPKDVLDHLEISDGELQTRDDDDDIDGRLKVVMTAPDVRHFSINGDGSLAIDGYDQDDLGVEISGQGDVTAKGKAHAVKLEISGNGNADFSELAAQSASADISGSGKASIAPTDEADLTISGSGEIDLLTHPAKVNSDISGSGHVVEGAAPAPSTPTSPTPPAAGSTKH